MRTSGDSSVFALVASDRRRESKRDRARAKRTYGADSRRTAPEEKESMSDERTTIVETTPSYSGALLGAIALAVLAALGGLAWSYTLSNRITRQEAALSEANQQNAKLEAQLRETNARLHVATDELGKSVGMTQKQLDARAQEIMAREAADNKRLETAQKQTAQQVTAVSSDVSSVKTDVGGVKTDLTKTQGDLATAVSQLQSMKGDLDNHSSLIARNGSELELLKQ